MKPIDWTKPLRTVSGHHPVQLLTTLRGTTVLSHVLKVTFEDVHADFAGYCNDKGIYMGNQYVENVPPPPPPVIGRWAVWWQHVGHEEPTLCLYTSEAAMNSEYAQKIVRHKRMAPPFFIELKPGWVDVTDSPEYRGYEL